MAGRRYCSATTSSPAIGRFDCGWSGPNPIATQSVRRCVSSTMARFRHAWSRAARAICPSPNCRSHSASAAATKSNVSSSRGRAARSRNSRMSQAAGRITVPKARVSCRSDSNMILNRLLRVACFCCLMVATGFAFQSSPANRPWPPGVQKVSNESPVLSPADALKTFFMPPGYHLELVASEPLVQDPTVMDWDLEGRLWVVEMTGFVRDLDAPEPNLDRIGNVVVLEDTNHDGKMDKRTVFADGLILPRALKVLDRGVLVGEPGSLWLMHDTNGDLKVDTKELVTNQYGRLQGGVEGNANGLYWGLDNRLYTTGEADVYFRLKDLKFEVLKTLERGEW